MILFFIWWYNNIVVSDDNSKRYTRHISISAWNAEKLRILMTNLIFASHTEDASAFDDKLNIGKKKSSRSRKLWWFVNPASLSSISLVVNKFLLCERARHNSSAWWKHFTTISSHCVYVKMRNEIYILFDEDATREGEINAII